MSADSTTSSRNPWFAAALSLLAIGAGHVYCGRIAAGLVLFGLWIVHIPLLSILAWIEPSRAALLTLLILPLIIQVALYFAAAAHAFWLASQDKAYVLRDYNRPLVYFILIFVGMTYPLLIAATIRTNLFEAYLVPTASMAPTIYRGERLLCNRARYLTRPIQRGDLVVFQPPGEGPSKKFVKRVIGLSGDEVTVLADGKIVLNGRPLEYRAPGDPTASSRLSSINADAELAVEVIDGRAYSVGLGESPAEVAWPLTVPEGQLYVLGDLRPASRDSRFFGPVDRAQVLGRLEYRYSADSWPRFGVVE